MWRSLAGSPTQYIGSRDIVDCLSINCQCGGGGEGILQRLMMR